MEPGVQQESTFGFTSVDNRLVKDKLPWVDLAKSGPYDPSCNTKLLNVLEVEFRAPVPVPKLIDEGNPNQFGTRASLEASKSQNVEEGLCIPPFDSEELYYTYEMPNLEFHLDCFFDSRS
ncbi:hypothetical protein ACH5RR_021681 [Cinchona calisaya]|uniref:Uncharacterized protein n=1 Tax=Cinchona calisaya TaxID=153742 RepID=A0ABD2ZLU0_9GENT